MRENGFDAVIGTLPENVLLLTGYFPVVGTSIAVAAADGEIVLLAPEDERELAEQGGADEVVTFGPASLKRLTSAAESVRDPLREVLRKHKLDHGTIGHECAEAYEPSSYASIHLYGDSIRELCDGASLAHASAFFARMRGTMTRMELDRMRRACLVAALAFESGRNRLTAGTTETEASEEFRAPLVSRGVGFDGASRADGYVFCMAGQHSANASGAYARSRSSRIREGDLVLTHCNSHADGYWTDITRTYCIGEPNELQRRMYEAVFDARAAALAVVYPGVEGCDVDRAAREVMASRGLADNFKHSTGHGVGFAAIDHNALPRLHPLSRDRLESGMVCNIEPAAYIEGFGGLRHCDVVAVTAAGPEVLTPFQANAKDVIR
jgi:Xaa-Pro dipeptidase